MDSKAQTGGMEYVMTYGWAIIFLLTAIGVFILVGNVPQQDMVCILTGSDDLVLKDFYIPFDAEHSTEGKLYWGDSSLVHGFGEAKAELVLQNVANGKLRIKNVSLDAVAGQGEEKCEFGELYGWELVGEALPETTKARFSIGEFNDHAIFPNCGSEGFVDVPEGQNLRFQKISFSLIGETGSEELFSSWKLARNTTLIFDIVYEDAFGSEKNAKVFCENFPSNPV